MENDKLEKPEAQPLKMEIILNPDGNVRVNYPMLNDKIASYGFLKVAEKVLDAYYVSHKPKIIQPKGGMLDFARRKK